MQILKIGSTGSEVALLKKGLNRAGYGPLALAGIFDAATERALTDFQSVSGLEPDGIFGPRTEQAMAPWFMGYTVHIIRRGDTLWRIANEYDTTLLALETANPELDPFNLQPGRRLVVPFSFPVVPTDIPYSSALVDYCVRGLSARYPGMETGIIGRSVLGHPLHRLTFGEGQRRVLYNAAHHGNEWITIPLLLKFTEKILWSNQRGESIGGVAAEELLHLCTFDIVPAVNPDGVDLVTGALQRGPDYDKAVAMAGQYPSVPFPDGWKANIRGTDPNLQYPAEWEEARRVKFEMGYTQPGPVGYVGPGPLAEPESLAMYEFTRQRDPALVLAYHTQGEVIYWKFLAMEPPGSRELAEKLSAVSGYAYEDTPYSSGFAGYKDWFIQAYDRPGYTIEAGLGENPLSIAQFDRIWKDNVGILVQAALG